MELKWPQDLVCQSNNGSLLELHRHNFMNRFNNVTADIIYDSVVHMMKLWQRANGSFVFTQGKMIVFIWKEGYKLKCLPDVNVRPACTTKYLISLKNPPGRYGKTRDVAGTTL